MRHFLPIKGPGGRALTVKEKVALVVLAVTLILCVLTLLAGDGAFGPEPAQNPVFAVVGALARSVGVGIIGLYAIVMLWSGLIFFKGERVAADKPLPGRAIAAAGIAVGISGMLGLAQLDAAGELGSLVGGAVGHAFGAVFGFAVLLSMLVLGGHLAGQGAWTALRGAAPAAAATIAPPVGGFTLPKQSPRVGGAECLPDDGDPSADERTRAIAQAMEEIERSKGVTIVDVRPERTSIGEEVEANAETEPHEEEAQVQSALDDVATALANLQTRLDREQAEARQRAAEEETDEIEEEDDDAGEARAATVTEPVEEETDQDAWAGRDEDDEDEDEDEDLEDEDDDLEDDEDDDEEEDDEDDLDDLDDEDDLEEDEDDWDDDDLDEREFEGEDDDDEWDEEAQVDEDEGGGEVEEEYQRTPTTISQPYLFPVARREIDEEGEEAEEGERAADGVAGARSTTIAEEEPAEDDAGDDGSKGTRFDWRGRPLD